MAHRLELSLKDALNSTPLKDIDKMLVGVYNYVYEKSPKKRRKLEGVIQKLRACLEEGEIPTSEDTGHFAPVAHALLLTK